MSTSSAMGCRIQPWRDWATSVPIREHLPESMANQGWVGTGGEEKPPRLLFWLLGTPLPLLAHAVGQVGLLPSCTS